MIQVQMKIKVAGKSWDKTTSETVTIKDWKQAVIKAYQTALYYQTEVRLNNIGSSQGHYFNYTSAETYLASNK